MNAGLFGGTFNPLHYGHLTVINHVKKTFSLDTVFLIPAAIPPHKTTRDLAPASDRLEMIQRSILDIPGLVASDIELKREGPSYTIDTVNYFKHILCKDTTLYLIMGSDAFFDIGTWKSTTQIFHRIKMIIMLRAGEMININSVASLINRVVSHDFKYNKEKRVFYHPVMKPVYLCDVPQIMLSSTQIRERVKRHLDIGSMVPAPVEAMIREKELYL